MANSIDKGLSLLLEQCVRRAYERGGSANLHPVQWAALRYYARAGRLTRTVAGLARFMGITKGPASRTTSRLVRRGYLLSEINEADRRVPFISLTEAGRNALQDDPILRLAESIGKLTVAERAAFASGLETVFESMLPDKPKGIEPVGDRRRQGQAGLTDTGPADGYYARSAKA